MLELGLIPQTSDVIASVFLCNTCSRVPLHSQTLCNILQHQYCNVYMYVCSILQYQYYSVRNDKIQTVVSSVGRKLVTARAG